MSCSATSRSYNDSSAIEDVTEEASDSTPRRISMGESGDGSSGADIAWMDGIEILAIICVPFLFFLGANLGLVELLVIDFFEFNHGEFVMLLM